MVSMMSHSASDDDGSKKQFVAPIVARSVHVTAAKRQSVLDPQCDACGTELRFPKRKYNMWHCGDSCWRGFVSLKACYHGAIEREILVKQMNEDPESFKSDCMSMGPAGSGPKKVAVRGQLKRKHEASIDTGCE